MNKIDNDFIKYKASTEQRWQWETRQLEKRYRHFWKIAHEASDLLKRKYNAKRVAVFGSLVHRELFHRHSDIDIAVWGMDEKRYYRAVAQLLMRDPDVSFDLILAEDAGKSINKRIEKEGIHI